MSATRRRRGRPDHEGREAPRRRPRRLPADRRGLGVPGDRRRRPRHDSRPTSPTGEHRPSKRRSPACGRLTGGSRAPSGQPQRRVTTSSSAARLTELRSTRAGSAPQLRSGLRIVRSAGSPRRSEELVEAAPGGRRGAAVLRRQLSARSPRSRQGRSEKRELLAFVFRLAFVLANVAFGYWLLARLRRRGIPLLRGRDRGRRVRGRSSHFVDGGRLHDGLLRAARPGPLVISLFGIAATLLAFVGLQRYLAKRIPAAARPEGRDARSAATRSRVGTHCEGCGREVIAPCATAATSRAAWARLHCGACGAA